MKAARLAFSLWAASRARGNHDLSTRRAVGGQPAAAGRGRASGGVCMKDNKCRAAPSAGAPQEREPGTFLTGHQTNPQPAPVCLPGQGRQMLLPGLSRPRPHHRTAQCPAEPAQVARRFVICRYETRALPRAVGHRDTPRRRHTRPRAGWRLRLVLLRVGGGGQEPFFRPFLPSLPLPPPRPPLPSRGRLPCRPQRHSVRPGAGRRAEGLVVPRPRGARLPGGREPPALSTAVFPAQSRACPWQALGTGSLDQGILFILRSFVLSNPRRAATELSPQTTLTAEETAAQGIGRQGAEPAQVVAG